MIGTVSIALSGLLASTKKLDASASNIANLTTTGSLTDKNKAPYSSLTTTQTAQSDNAGNGQGVLADIIPKQTAFTPSYSPQSPFADENGYIGVPNTNLAEEAVNISLAKYQFQANLKIIETSAELSKELLSAFDKDA